MSDQGDGDPSPGESVDWTRVVDPRAVIGLGVAGNFAGHLEQAGEASDFVGVKAAAGAPKGVFPFHVPTTGTASEHFLHTFPVSADVLRLGSLAEKHQIEPEVALLCELEYDGEGEGRVVRGVRPRFAMAHNDCSIRREGARKISEKKNWGAETKGTAATGVGVDHLGEGGVLDGYRLASFLVRGGERHAYGQDSPLAGPEGYSYFHERLLEWLAEKLREQRDEGPLEDIRAWLRIAGHPRHALVSIGATRYTDFGETHFLEIGDRIVVALYDAKRFSASQIEELALAPPTEARAGLSLLSQEVVGP